MKLADKLRKAVLQAAVQGKLTEQLSEDGNAEDELRKYLGKHYKTVPENDYPFEISNNWSFIRFNDIFSPISSNNHQIKSSEVKDKGKFPVVSQGKKFVDGFFDNESKLLIVDKPIILFGDHTKELKFIDFDFIVGADGTKLLNVKFGLERFMYYHLMFIVFQLGTRNYGRHFKLLRNNLIAFPPLLEQKRIVEKLDQILPMIDAFEKDENILEEIMTKFPDQMKASILQAAMQGKLTEQLPEDGNAEEELKRLLGVTYKKVNIEDYPFEIPENWVFIKLGKIIDIVSGTSYRKTNIEKSGLRIIRGGNVNNDSHQIDFFDDDVFVNRALYNEEKNLKENDIVIVASTGSKKVIGKPAFIKQDFDNIQIGAFLRIIRPKHNEYSDYLRILFSSRYYRNYISKITQGTNINNIKNSYINEFLITLPPLEEQKRIVEKLDSLLPLVGSLKI